MHILYDSPQTLAYCVRITLSSLGSALSGRVPFLDKDTHVQIIEPPIECVGKWNISSKKITGVGKSNQLCSLGCPSSIRKIAPSSHTSQTSQRNQFGFNSVDKMFDDTKNSSKDKVDRATWRVEVSEPTEDLENKQRKDAMAKETSTPVPPIEQQIQKKKRQRSPKPSYFTFDRDSVYRSYQKEKQRSNAKMKELNWPAMVDDTGVSRSPSAVISQLPDLL